MTFTQAVSAVLRRYADFNGRARRSEYWKFTLFIGLVEFALIMVGAGIIVATTDATSASTSTSTSGLEVVGLGIFFLGYVFLPLAVALPCMAVTARRLHDRNLSGWMQLINLIPFIGWIVMLVLLVQDSDPGANHYGPNPKNPYATDGPGSHYGQPLYGTPQDRPFGGHAAGPWVGQGTPLPPYGASGGRATGPVYPPPPPTSGPQGPYPS